MSSFKKTRKLFLLTGGGTAGSVTPLLAIAEILREHSAKLDFIWLGTATGPERQLVEEAGIDFKAISAGKLRRYWSWQNIIDIGRLVVGFFQASYYLNKFRPTVIVSAGSFVSVPIAWAAKLFGIPIIIEQLDYRPGLANRLMAPLAKKILVTFAKSGRDYGHKAIWLGAPIRPNILQPVNNDLTLPWFFTGQRPIILIVGGGTGASGINDLVIQQLANLTKLADIIHLTGRGKVGSLPQEHYQPLDFLNQNEMIAAYQVADIVVARAGLGTLIELAALKKASLIIPMPDSHQLDNAQAIKQVDAAIVAQEKDLVDGQLTVQLKQLLADKQKQADLISNWPKAIKIANQQEIIKVFQEYL
jgi:UDP-N-acetylglucosamine--N-acetylmuramyl-(pentapeptide) pyrophosphoryl-undecaprenol N-acetylglucosamine transferase